MGGIKANMRATFTFRVPFYKNSHTFKINSFSSRCFRIWIERPQKCTSIVTHSTLIVCLQIPSHLKCMSFKKCELQFALPVFSLPTDQAVHFVWGTSKKFWDTSIEIYSHLPLHIMSKRLQSLHRRQLMSLLVNVCLSVHLSSHDEHQWSGGEGKWKKKKKLKNILNHFWWSLYKKITILFVFRNQIRGKDIRSHKTFSHQPNIYHAKTFFIPASKTE